MTATLGAAAYNLKLSFNRIRLTSSAESFPAIPVCSC